MFARRGSSALFAFGLAVEAACGGRTTPVEADAGDGAHGPIPDPGTSSQVNVDFVDVEPNDTPAQATPLGIAASGDLVIWVGSNAIGGASNPADYFVFESGPAPANLQFNMCFMPDVTKMTASLWKVEGGTQVTPAIASWTISGTCGTSFTAPLEASTDYLFGVFATGGPGTYTA